MHGSQASTWLHSAPAVIPEQTGDQYADLGWPTLGVRRPHGERRIGRSRGTFVFPHSCDLNPTRLMNIGLYDTESESLQSLRWSQGGCVDLYVSQARTSFGLVSILSAVSYALYLSISNRACSAPSAHLRRVIQNTTLEGAIDSTSRLAVRPLYAAAPPQETSIVDKRTVEDAT